jgi:putative flippase GtrA
VILFSKFAFVGALATALHFAVMVLLVQAFHFNAAAASSLGFAVSALFNYQLNRVFTFRSHSPHSQTLPRFLLVACSGLLVNTSLMLLFVDVCRIPYVLAQVPASGAVLVWNFFLNRRWTFARA